MRRPLPVLLLALAFASPVRAEPEGADFFPLAEGTVWTFDTRYEQSGPYEVKRTGTLVERVEGIEEIGGRRYTRVAWTVTGIGTEDVRDARRVRIDDEGAWYVYEGREHLGLPFPPEIGRTWAAKEPAPGWTYRVERAPDVVETPAGRFEHCIEIVQALGDGRTEGRETRCPGVGRVRLVTTARVPTPAGELVGVTDNVLTQREPAP